MSTSAPPASRTRPGAPSRQARPRPGPNPPVNGKAPQTRRRVQRALSSSRVSPPRQVDRRSPRVELTLTAEHIGSMPRALPVLVERAAQGLVGNGGARKAAGQVVIDVSNVPPMPSCAPIVCLLETLRRRLGPAVRLTLTGAPPWVSAPLIGCGLGPNTEMYDHRGRWWN